MLEALERHLHRQHPAQRRDALRGCAWLGRYDEALTLLDRAVEGYRAAGDLESLGRALAEIGRVHAWRGTPSDGIDRLQSLLASLEGQALEEGLSLARSMSYPYAEARLLHVHGEMHVLVGGLGLGRESLEAALAIFRRLGARKDAERTEQLLTTLG